MDKGGFDSNKVRKWTRLVNTVCIIIIIVCFIIIVMPGTAARLFSGPGSGNNNASTTKREALPAGSVNETAYFMDEAYLDDPIVVEEGLKLFYEMTGVQPYIDIITSIKDNDNPSVRDIAAYARPRYSQLFTDESHLLLVFCFDFEWDNYDCYIVTGSKAKTVIDSEAESILSGYIKFYFDDLGISEEMFSNAFSDAADRIMNNTPPTSDIPVFIFLGVLAVFVLLFVWLRSINKKRKIRARQNEEILGMPLEQYGAESGDKTEIPVHDDSSASEGFMEVNNGANIAMAQEAHIKRQIDMNTAEAAKYEDLARQALQAGKEDDARIFIEKKQNLEAARAVLDAAYANVAGMRRMQNDMMSGMGNIQSRQTVNVKTTVTKNGKIISQTSYTNNPQGAPDAFSHTNDEAGRLFASANAMFAAMDAGLSPAMGNYGQAAQGDAVSAKAGPDPLPKDEAEILAEKYAAQRNAAPAGENKHAARSKASVDDELARIKSDMGL